MKADTLQRGHGVLFSDQIPTHCLASSRKLSIFYSTSTVFYYPSQTNSGNKILPWGREGSKMLMPFCASFSPLSISLLQVQLIPEGWELNYCSQKMEGTIFKTGMSLHFFLSTCGWVPPLLMMEGWLLWSRSPRSIEKRYNYQHTRT